MLGGFTSVIPLPPECCDMFNVKFFMPATH